MEADWDLGECSAWLRPKHLTPDAIHQYREQFESHPARLLRISGILLPEVASRLATFCGEEVEFERIYGIVGRANVVPEADWLGIDASRRLFTFERLVQPRPEFKLSRNLLTFMKFRNELVGGSIREYVRKVSGIPLGKLSAFNGQSLREGDYLRPHRDTLNRRRLAFIFYLNPVWQPEFGGALRVVNPNDGEHILPVEHNSLVMFDVDAHQYHEILPILPLAGDQRRLTLGGWYLDATREAGALSSPTGRDLGSV